MFWDDKRSCEYLHTQINLLICSLLLQKRLPASHLGQERPSVSLVLSKASEPSKDEVQLQMVALNNYQLEMVDVIGDKKQCMEYSASKNFDNIKCVFVLLIIWDVMLLVVVVPHVGFISSCCRRFSVLWPMLLLRSQSKGTIQKCPQGDLQVWWLCHLLTTFIYIHFCFLVTKSSPLKIALGALVCRLDVEKFTSKKGFCLLLWSQVCKKIEYVFKDQ